MAELTMTDRIVMARARERMLEHPEARQRAIAEFPLRVVQLARDLKLFCDIRDTHPDPFPADSLEAMTQMEKMILDEFRFLFGHEMIAENSTETHS